MATVLIKPYLTLSILLLVLSCQGPSGPAAPVEQPIPLPSSMPSVSSAPPAAPSDPVPSEAPQPQPTPVQRVEVVDITPPEFLAQNQGEIYGLTIDNDSPVPRLFLNYGSSADPDKSYSGLWAFQEGQSAERIWAAYRTAQDDFNSMQYYEQDLYVLETENQKRCLKRYSLDKLMQPETILCQTEEKALQTFKITDSGQIFVYGRFRPEGIFDARPTTYHISEVQRQGLQTRLISNSVGTSRILKVMILNAGGTCFGICYVPSSDGGIWLDEDAKVVYTVNGFSLSPVANASDWLSEGALDPLSNVYNKGDLKLLKDGSSAEVTFWRPSGLDVDQDGHVYIKEELAEENLIRRVNFEKKTETLISANGLSDFGYPQSQINLKALLPDAIKSSRKAEAIGDYVIDRQRDWLYILGYDLYRFDLRTGKLEHLIARRNQLNRLGESLTIDAQGNLYTINGNRINKIVILQPENR